MKLSQGEKLILLALAAAKDGEEEIDLDFIRSAILSGQTWALSWELSGVPTEDTSPDIADETGRMLTMWSFIETSIARLPEADREALEKDAYPFDLSFSGFDGNHDAHYGVAGFMINKMNRFEEFRDRPLNSHTQSSIPRYRRMLDAYNREMGAVGFGSHTLSADAILRIVKPE